MIFLDMTIDSTRLLRHGCLFNVLEIRVYSVQSSLLSIFYLTPFLFLFLRIFRHFSIYLFINFFNYLIVRLMSWLFPSVTSTLTYS